MKKKSKKKRTYIKFKDRALRLGPLEEVVITTNPFAQVLIRNLTHKTIFFNLPRIEE